MNDLIDICKISGEVSLDGENIYQRGIDVVQLRQRVGMVFQKAQSVPDVDLGQRRLRPATARHQT